MSRLRLAGGRVSSLRTSSRDRDQAIDLLSDFYAQGRLDHDEYDERVARAMRVGSYGQLRALFEGLPVDPKRLPRPPGDGRRVWLGMGTAVLVAAVGGGVWFLASPGGTEPDEPSAAPPATTSPRSTPEPRSTPVPTPASTPTASLEPSTETAPRNDEPTDRTVAPITRSGTGTTIVTVPWTAGVTPMIDFEVDRADYEPFTLSDADGNPFFTYVDADGRGGRASGATVMSDYDVPTENRLLVKVETAGAWTITLRDVQDAPALARSGSGSGYQVGRYDGPEGVFSMSADAGNFAVWDGWNLVVNGIGPERDEGVIAAGPRLLRIEADAPWRYESR